MNYMTYYMKILMIVSFNTDEIRSKYINLLKTELKIIQTLPLEDAARKLYYRKYSKSDDKVSVRCFDFKLLESGAVAWIEDKSKSKVNLSH